MKTIIVLAVAVAVALSTPAIDSRIAKFVNSQQKEWKAGVNEFFVGKTKDDVKKLLGWKKDSFELPTKDIKVDATAIPTTFDSSANWPNCKTIGTIYNQADCGSCWAFGCVEAVSDRFCIASQGKVNEILSFEDMVSCGPCDGCDGGDADSAWEYVAETGLVTGTCYPYDIPTCPPAQQPCLNFVNTPACLSGKCNDSEAWSTFTLTEAYDVSSDVSKIQTEIMTNGPVEACFDVYEDFVTYKTGVYSHTTGSYLGGHCVKCIGWGVENGTPYWLCNNQWTTYWGDNGQFKIKRGSDECGIEDDVVAGTPNLQKN